VIRESFAQTPPCRILEQTNSYKWQFLFLGANQDAIATAANLSISEANTFSYTGDHAGTRSSTRAASRKMTAMRKMASGARMSVNENADAAAPLAAIVAEEDAEERKSK